MLSCLCVFVCVCVCPRAGIPECGVAEAVGQVVTVVQQGLKQGARQDAVPPPRVLRMSATISPYRPSTSAKMRIRIMPTKSCGGVSA